MTDSSTLDDRRDVSIAVRVLVIVVPLLVYANTIQNPFHYDDAHSIVENIHIRSLSNVPSFFIDPGMFSAEESVAMYRPLLLTSFALNYAISDYEVWSYHLVNIGLHATCAFLVFLLGRALSLSVPAAALAALIFGVHPINSEAVNYISSRSELAAAAFMLLACWSFLRRDVGHDKWVWVVGAYAAGLLNKSVAIVSPLALYLLDALVRGRWFPRRTDWRTYLGLLLVSLGYVLIVWKFLRKAAVGAPVRPFSEQFFSQTKAAVLYFKLLLWPSNLSVDHQFLISDSALYPFDPTTACAGAFCLSGCFWVWYHRRRYPLVSFLFGFSIVVLLPSSLIPLNVLVNEHRLYLPSAAFGLAVGYFADSLFRRDSLRLWLGIGGTIALAALAMGSVSRNQVWASEYALWSDAAKKAPLMARPHFYLAQAQRARGERVAAVSSLEHAIRRDPGFGAAYASLGEIYREQGQFGQAIDAAGRGLEVDPEEVSLWRLMAESYLEMSRRSTEDKRLAYMEQTLRAYRRGLGLEPNDDALHNNVGNALQVLGRPAEALEHHKRALELNPGDAATYLNMGAAHSLMGDWWGAGESFAEAVGIDPDFAMAWYNLGLASEKLGRPDRAREAYERAGAVDAQYRQLVDARLRQLRELGVE